MPKIIVASRYLKPAAKGTRGNLVKYIATRETVQKYSPKKKDMPVTENQQQLIFELLKINSDGKKLPEYSDYLKNPSKENASELIAELIERNSDRIADREIFIKYLAERPGVEKIGKHGLFSGSDDKIILSQAQNRTIQKRSLGLKNPLTRGINSHNTHLAAYIFMGTVLYRTIKKRLNTINCPPIRITPTLAMKPRKCFVTG